MKKKNESDNSLSIKAKTAILRRKKEFKIISDVQ